MRKLRKIVGFYSPASYLNEANGTLLGKKYKFLKGLVNQPKGNAIGLDSFTDIRADVTFQRLIEAYELKYNRVVLDSCDWQTDLKEKYNCAKIKNEEGKKYFILTYRNQILSDFIINSKSSNILIVYGKGHLKGLLQNLQKNDKAWKFTEE